ncbi:hypothetical protein IJ114_00355 [Candidatus Saccharibacteria bacterium]|nr:hypothetical protein [Candidatus Saccharibacteria bacterium]
MAKKVTRVKREIESSFNFSKFYFSKPTSVALVTTYVTILVLVLSTLGLSKIITPKTDGDNEVPNLPETTFAFLPADNIEIPELGDANAEPKKETPTTNETNKPSMPESESVLYSTSAPVTTPVVVEVPKEVTRTIEKEVVKTVEVPKDVVKTVEVPKEVVKEVEVSKEPEQTYLENYYAPDDSPIGPAPIYINYPDVEEPTAQEEAAPTETQGTEEASAPIQNTSTSTRDAE